MISKKITQLLCYLGYVEDQRLAGVLLDHTPGFTSLVDALKDLYQTLYESLKKDLHIKSCCAVAEGNFCPDCGRNLNYKEIDQESVVSLLQDVFNGTNNDMSQELVEDLQEKGWSIGFKPSVNCKVVVAIDRIFADEITQKNINRYQ